MMTLASFMTQTCIHKNNPTGAATLSTVATGISCTPLDALSSSPSQDYPVEKMFVTREFFTKYTAFQAGDYATFSGTDYPILAVEAWESQGDMDDFYRVLVEISYGS